MEKILFGGMLRNLTEEEMNRHREPYEIVESQACLVWTKEIPINGRPADVHKIVADHNKWLQETGLPKILFCASPGAITNVSAVNWSESNLKNLESVDLGQGIHYLQEDHSNSIGKALANWIQEQESKPE
jgi:haloalkane dehalogenase